MWVQSGTTYSSVHNQMLITVTITSVLCTQGQYYLVIYQNITHLKTPNNDIHLTSVTYAGTKWGKKAHILTLHTPHTFTLHPPSYPHTRPFLLLCSWGCPQRTPRVTQIHTSWVLVWERTQQGVGEGRWERNRRKNAIISVPERNWTLLCHCVVKGVWLT